jgi:TonB family protein
VDFPDMKANCIADEAGYEINRYCFDPSTKVLIETAWAKHKERAKGGTWYLDYRQTEGQHFPGTIRRFSKGGAVTGPDIGNIQVVPAQFDPALFSVPANAREFETCDDMQMARLAKKGEPIYPQEAKLAHLQGDVYIAAVIGEDGKVEDLRPVRGAPVLIQSVLDAVKQWRYSPAMCGTKPVAVQTELLVQFLM